MILSHKRLLQKLYFVLIVLDILIIITARNISI